MSRFIPELEIREIERLVVESLHRDLTGWKDTGFLFTTRGMLDNVSSRKEAAKQARWSKVFGVKLVADGSLTLNAKHELLESYLDGDYVEIVGYPTLNFFNSQLQLQMEVVAIRLAESQAQRTQRHAQRHELQSVQSLRPTRNVFPMQPSIRVDLVYSSASSAKVDEDFLRSLGREIAQCIIQRVPVRMSSAQHITTAIATSHADVLVLIRGGGADSDFEVFNTPSVVTALAKCTAYRIVGLGHSANRTQLDLLADYSASVPADAGAHLALQLANIGQFIADYEANWQGASRSVNKTPRHYEPSGSAATPAPASKADRDASSESAPPASRKWYVKWSLLLGLLLLVWLVLKYK